MTQQPQTETQNDTVSVTLCVHQYLEFCDEVLVLRDGSVLETGNHQDLMKVEGHYAELITKHLREPTTVRPDT